MNTFQNKTEPTQHGGDRNVYDGSIYISKFTEHLKQMHFCCMYLYLNSVKKNDLKN